MTLEALRKQMNDYRAETKKKPGSEVYTLSSEIIFMEGIAAQLEALCKEDAAAADAIAAAGEDKTLLGCARHCMERAKKRIGRHGDLPSDDMAMLVWEYFTM